MADEIVSSALVIGSTTLNGEIYTSSLTSATIDGTVNVYSGGVVDYSYVSSGGILNISSGGKAENIELSNGSMFVNSGGYASNVDANVFANLEVAGGFVEDVNFSKGGTVRITKGGSGSNIHISNGTISIQQSATVAENISATNGKINIFNATVSSVRIETDRSGAITSQYVLTVTGDGGRALVSDMYVGSLTSAVVSSGTLHGFTVENAAEIKVYNGVKLGGKMFVDNGGAVSVQPNPQDPGEAASAYLEFTVSEHTTDGGFLVNDLSAFSGNFVYSIKVDSTQTGMYQLAGNVGDLAGEMAFYIDGVFKDDIEINGNMLENGNIQYYLTVNAGNLILDIKEYWPEIVVSNTLTVKGEKLVNATVTEGGKLNVDSGAVISRTTVESGGTMTLGSGTTASGTVVSSGGSMTLSSGTTASGTVVSSGGSMIISSGTVIQDTVFESGANFYLGQYVSASGTVFKAAATTQGALRYLVLSDTVIENTKFSGVRESELTNTVLSSGTLGLTSGTVADGITGFGTLTVNMGAQASNVSMTSGTIYVYSGSLHNLELNGSKGIRAVVSSGGVIGGKITLKGAAQITGSGGIVDFTVAEHSLDGGFLINDLSKVSGVTYTITVAEDQSCGRYLLAQNSSLSTSLTISLYCGTSATGLSLQVGGEAVTYGDYSYQLEQTGKVLSLNITGNNIEHTVISSGEIVSSAMVASNLLVEQTGGLTLLSGGIIEGGSINQKGSVYIDSGASASGLTVSRSGVLYISSGGYAQNTDIFGTMNVSKGGSVKNADVFNSARLNLYASTTAEDITVYQGGTMTTGNGATLANINIAGGSFTASNSITVNGLYVASGGSVTLNGGTVTDLKVESGASVYLGSTTITGSLLIESGADVSGGNLLLDLSERSIYDSYLIEELGNTSNLTITIRVDRSQAAGTYVIAADAANFTGSNAINFEVVHSGTTDSSSYVSSSYGGTIYAGLGPVLYSSSLYRLRQSNGMLVMDVVNGVNDSSYLPVSVYISGSSFYDIETFDQMLSSGNSIEVSSGGIAHNTLLSGGTMSISSGGIAHDTIIERGRISMNGGSAINTIVSSGGNISIGGGVINRVTNKAVLENTTIYSGGRLNVLYAPNASNTFIQAGANVNGFTLLVDNKIERGLNISSAVVSSAAARVSSGAEYSDLLVTDMAIASIFYGATVHRLTVTNGGSASVTGQRSGVRDTIAVVSGAEILSNGHLNIHEYSYLYDANVGEDSVLTVSSGTAYRVNVYGNGSLDVITGKVSGVTLNDSATLSIENGTVKSAVLNGGQMNVISDANVMDTVLHGGTMVVSSINAEIQNTFVDSSGLVMVSSGVANDTTVGNGGTLFLADNGSAYGIIVSSGGSFIGKTALTAEDVTVLSGGNFLGFTLNHSQTFTYLTGKYLHETISGAVFSNGNTQTINGSSFGFTPLMADGGAIIDTIIGGGQNSCTIQINSGGYANSTTILTKGRLFVYNSGSADNTVVHSGGSLTTSGNAYLNNVTLYFGATLNAGMSSIVNNLIINSGATISAFESGTIVYNPWEGYLNSYGTVESGSSSVIRLARDAKIYYGGSGEGSFAEMNGGAAFISKFDSCTDFKVASNNSAIIYRNGVAENIYVNYGGCLIVSSGGSATVAYNPWAGDVINQGGIVERLGRDANVYYGGSAAGFISKYKQAANLEVTSGNSAILFDRGLASDTTISDGGTMILNSGSIHKGSLTIEKGGSVKVNGKVTVDFTLTGRTADCGVIINDISAIHNNAPIYTITVSEDQEGGTYILAGNAASFSEKSISIGDEREEFGYIDVNGDSLYVDDTVYTLTLDGDYNLTLNILNGYNTKAFLWEGGRLISGGITMKSANVQSGQSLQVSSGGTVVTGNIFDGGVADFTYGARANTLYAQGGTVNLSSGAVIDNAKIAQAEVNVLSGATISEMQMMGGEVTFDGTLRNGTVNAGTLTVGATGVLKDVKVNRAGTLVFEAGSQLTGTITIQAGAAVTFEEGSKIVLDIADGTPGKNALISNISLASGAPEIALRASEKQAVGTYNLVAAAGSTWSCVNITVDDITAGILTQDGQSTEYGKKKYTIIESSNGNIQLSVSRSSAYGGSAEDDWEDLRAAGSASFAGKSYALTDENLEINDWAGFGDAVDYMQFDLDCAAALSFDITTTDNIKFTIYSLTGSEGNYGLKTLQNTSVNLGRNAESASSSTKLLMLEAGSYYVAVNSTNAANGGDAEYSIRLNGDSEFFSEGDNSDDWSDLKENGSASAEYGSFDIAGFNEINGWVGLGDSVDYMQFDLESSAKLSFNIESSENIKFYICALEEKNGSFSLKKLQTSSLSKSGKVYTVTSKDLLLESGSYYLCIENSNASKGSSASYSITLGDSAFFFPGSAGEAADDWLDLKTSGSSGLGGGTCEVTEANSEITAGWVGYGDTTDYFRITLPDAAELSFHVTATDEAKFTIYTLVETSRGGVTTYSLKALQSTSLKLDKVTGMYVADTKDLLLNGDNSDYYIAVSSTNAAKGGNAQYTVTVNGSSTFFTAEDDGNNWSDLASMGAQGEVGETVVITAESLGATASENGSTDGEGDGEFEEEETLVRHEFENGWVGYNDAVDYLAFSLEDSAKLSFNVTATDEVKFTIYTLESKVDKGKTVYYLKALQNSSLKLDKTTGYYTVDTKALLLTGDNTYYIGVTSPNAAKGGNAEYAITLNSSSIIFSGGNSADDTWNGEIASCGLLRSGEESTITFSDWVGMGDKVDFASFTVEHDMDANFSILASDTVKLNIYYVNEQGELKSVLSASAKANKSVTTKTLGLETGTTYYISVTSTNAEKGGNAIFTVTGQAAGIKAKITAGAPDADVESLLALWDADSEKNWEEFAANVPDSANAGFIRGTASKDEIIFIGSKSRFIDGIALGIGDDKVTFNDSNAKSRYDNFFTPVDNESGTRSGAIDLGSGNDTLKIGKYNLVDGLDSVLMGEGNDRLEIGDHAELYVYGCDSAKGLIFGDGDDTLVIAPNGYLRGLPQFGEGNDTLQLEGTLDLRGCTSASASQLYVEHIHGKGVVLISDDIDSGFAAIFADSEVKIVNTITDSRRFSTTEEELKDNTAAKAQALAAGSELDLWLCSEERAAASACGFSDTADFIKVVKNDGMSSIEFTWDDGSGSVTLQQTDARDNVLAEYDLSGSGNTIDISEWANGTYYFKVGVAESSMASGCVTVK